ncbi:toprim domain-containing protein, partial [Escherichia coli]|uniref:toprim domain-containing protein n=2 Tax=Bacteria TaxID=2 RepID=UPI0011158F15
AVIVEGYTDVMAAQLSGVEGAVATCGTAFGIDHIKILRRIMRDEADGAPAKVIFTFDGDAAGQKAAMKAFGEDQRWASQSFVAVAPDG